MWQLETDADERLLGIDVLGFDQHRDHDGDDDDRPPRRRSNVPAVLAGVAALEVVPAARRRRSTRIRCSMFPT